MTRRGIGARPNLVALAGPGDIVGELSVFDPGPRTSSVVAVGGVKTVWLDRGSLRRWLVGQPHVGLALLQLLSRQVKRRHDQFAERRVHDVGVRVARQLHDLAARFGVEDSGCISLPELTVDELADLVGAATPTVVEVLRELVTENIVRPAGASFGVRNLGALIRLANPPG
jgi:CRP/FNR family transcriptional regulator, cyclic AMP receptor protein